MRSFVLHIFALAFIVAAAPGAREATVTATVSQTEWIYQTCGTVDPSHTVTKTAPAATITTLDPAGTTTITETWINLGSTTYQQRRRRTLDARDVTKTVTDVYHSFTSDCLTGPVFTSTRTVTVTDAGLTTTVPTYTNTATSTTWWPGPPQTTNA